MISTNPKDRIGKTKPPISLIPPVALIHEAMAMKDGADKYGPYNWRTSAVSLRVYLDACLRHLLSFSDGEDHAEDSGVHHLAHARACLGIIFDAASVGNLIDDRAERGKAAELIAELTQTINICQATGNPCFCTDNKECPHAINP